MKYIITVALDADTADTTGYDAWDFYPALDPDTVYETREKAESEAMLAYIGADEYGVAAIAIVEEI